MKRQAKSIQNEYPEKEIKPWRGKGIALIPWGNAIRNKKVFMKHGKDWYGAVNANISIAPVLVSHYMNKEHDVCLPSQDRISALAGIRKEFVQYNIDKNMFTVSKVTQRNNRKRTEYRRIYDKELEPRSYISISHYIIFNGIWANLTPSAKRLYLVLKAFTYPGCYAALGGEAFNMDYSYSGETRFDCDITSDIEEYDYDFLPQTTLENIYEEQPLSLLCGLEERTYRRAYQELKDKELILSTDDSYAKDGLIFPNSNGKWYPETVKRANMPTRTISTKTKRTVRRLLNSTKSRDDILCEKYLAEQAQPQTATTEECPF